MCKKVIGGFIEIVLIFTVVVAIAVSALVIFGLNNFGSYVENSSSSSNLSNNLVPEETSIPTPTPVPFQELTIPYLRNREYTSDLVMGDLFEEKANYMSYLASYDSEGFRVDGLLLEPKGEVPESGWPGIVFVHGYIPPKEYETTQNYASYAEYFVNNGFVVFKIDLRGHDESEGDPGGAYYSGDYVIDTLNAYSAMQSYKDMDPERIGLWGHSMAGNVTFRAFVAKRDILAIVIWSGAVYTYDDMEDFRIQDNSYQPPDPDSARAKKRAELRETHGSYDPESEFWQSVVPTNYLDGVIGALQVHHARNDNVVNIGYSRNLMDVLDDSNIEHQLIEHPSGGHNITGQSFIDAMQNSVEFFEENL